jgi:hypothetical protein
MTCQSNPRRRASRDHLEPPLDSLHFTVLISARHITRIVPSPRHTSAELIHYTTCLVSSTPSGEALPRTVERIGLTSIADFVPPRNRPVRHLAKTTLIPSLPLVSKLYHLRVNQQLRARNHCTYVHPSSRLLWSKGVSRRSSLRLNTLM